MLRTPVRSLAAAAVLALAAAVARADAPQVVASIMPVHSLVAGVMDGVGEPVLLVKGGGSPHTYSLRPSEAAALQDADVIFWIGPGLEAFLETPLEALPHHARVVALHEVDGVTLLPYRAGGAWEKHMHHHGEGHADHDVHEHEEHAAEHHHGDEHEHGAMDMHIWLDPDNARAMVAGIVASLSSADPANAARYAANGEAMTARIDAVDKELTAELAPDRGRPYVVFHDAYQYFDHHYGLSPVGSITLSPDRAPGAGRLMAIREKIKDTGATCVFAEPQFEPAVIGTVVEGTGARTGVLDPLGADLTPGPDAYPTLLRNLGAALTACLAAGS